MADSCGITCMKYTLFFLNFVAWLLGLAILGISIWVLVDPDMRDFVEAMEFEHYYTGCYILVAVGVLVIIVGFLGCCGAITENLCMIQTFFFIMMIIFVMEMSAAIYILVVGVNAGEDVVNEQIEENMYKMLYNYNDDDIQWAMDQMQQNLECCGVKNGYDYDTVNLPVPDSCRDEVTGNQFEDGCLEAFQDFLNSKSGLIAGLTLGIACFHIAAIVMSVCLCMGLKKEAKMGV